MKVYWYPDEYNVGDTLTPHIIKHFLKCDIERAGQDETGKLVAVGSVMSKVRTNDIVWGTGCIREKEYKAPAGVKFLAVRGPLTRGLIKGAEVPEVYGDPALLLPLMYMPDIEKTHRVGIIPHYVDKKIVMSKYAFASGFNKFIDVALPWKQFVDEVLSCERVESSSLHGIVIAEAYGIPATWMKYSEKVIGNGFKFRDYQLGTGREPKGTGEVLDAIPNKRHLLDTLLGALYSHYENKYK
jgi:pyruvyltransferase